MSGKGGIMEKLPDELGFVLHDRSTTGESLTAEEEQQLKAWYEARDEAEAVWLNSGSEIRPDLANLHSQIDVALNELTVVTQRIQQVSFENQEIRQEIADLYQQLAIPRSA
jgi:uncharacterized coiled-coil DUF342 family protein